LGPSAEALNGIGLIQIQRGKPRDAVSSFTAALQQQSDFAPAVLNMAVVYHQHLNDRRLALMNYRQFLKVAKQAPEGTQVEMLVQHLDAELNPPPVVTNVPPPVAAKPPAPVVTNRSPVTTVSVPAKPETNLAVEPSPQKPPLVIASPKAQPLPKKEPPVEVAKLPDETPIKAAQDIPPSSVSKPVTVPAPNVSVAPANPVNVNNPPEKGGSVLTKLNPTSWFKKKPKATTPVTDLSATKPAVETSAPVIVAEKKPSQKAPAKTKTSQPTVIIPRYKYRSPPSPKEGSRAEAQPFFDRGVQAQKDRRLADALGAYRQAIKLDPAYYEANYNLALAARDAGDLSAALGAYEAALAIMPESVNARYNFAFTLQEAGYFQDAANELRKLLAQNPNETRAYLLLGNLCAQRLNQISSAREAYLKVLEAEPNHPQATQIRYWLAAHP
jgi:tetratricopeptide (TPR) repeat protein